MRIASVRLVFYHAHYSSSGYTILVVLSPNQSRIGTSSQTSVLSVSRLITIIASSLNLLMQSNDREMLFFGRNSSQRTLDQVLASPLSCRRRVERHHIRPIYCTFAVIYLS